MKKVALMLVFVLLVAAIAHAEMLENKELGVKFEIPEGFKKAVDTKTIKSWSGPKTGEIIWSLQFNVTPIPQGVGSKQMHDINFKGDKSNTKTYSSVKPLKVKGAGGGAYLMKEVKKPDSDIYRWLIKAFGKNNMYTWNFSGSYSTFKKYEPIIMKTMKSAVISK